jgi:arginase
MAIVYVPYHQDERQPDSSIPVRWDDPVYPVTPDLPQGDIWTRLTTIYAGVAEHVDADARRGAAPVVLSGDCLVSMGVLTGLQRAGTDPAIVWFDAHGDVHTIESSTSGYPGGMALRFLLGANYDVVGSKLGYRPLTEERAVLVDARDLDPAEIEYLAQAKVRHCPVNEVVLPDGPLILHVDVDVMDPGEVPGLAIPAPDGPSKQAVLQALREIRASGQIVATDIACTWKPDDGLEQARRDLLDELICG